MRHMAACPLELRVIQMKIFSSQNDDYADHLVNEGLKLDEITVSMEEENKAL